MDGLRAALCDLLRKKMAATIKRGSGLVSARTPGICFSAWALGPSTPQQCRPIQLAILRCRRRKLSMRSASHLWTRWAHFRCAKLVCASCSCPNL